MSDLAVVHPDLGTRGGAESVCMQVLEALQDDHDLSLFTLSRPDVPALNDYFDTDVRPPEIRLAGLAAPEVRARADNRLLRLQAALLGRYVHRRADRFDLVVSTKNEFDFGAPSVQYVHSPQFASTDPGLDRAGLPRRTYEGICNALAAPDGDDLHGATVLANSRWTAGVVEETYGVDAETVYPPVDGSEFPERAWTEREDGFLTIGRIGPSKRVLRNVGAVERLRERGHDVHLHVVGPTTDDDYSRRVERAAAEREFVTLEGAVDRETLIDLVTTHRYGLHGRPYEHFGIAVAELVAGGTVPFAPASGGQREVLGEDDRLLYDSADDAVEKIDRVLSDPELQRSLRERLDAVSPAPDPGGFRANVRGIVERALA